MASVTSRPPHVDRMAQVDDLTLPSFDDDVAARTRHRLPTESRGERLVDRLDVRSRFDELLSRFEIVANDFKKDLRKLQDLEAARGLPSSFGPRASATPPNTKPLPNLPPKNTVNPFFLLLPPTATISPANLCLIWLAAEHMLHSSPTGHSGSQRFVDVYESRRHAASSTAQPESEAARQNVRLTKLIYSALLHLGLSPTVPNPNIPPSTRPASPSTSTSSSELKRAVSPSPSVSSDPISRLLRKSPTHSIVNASSPTSAYDRLVKRSPIPPVSLQPARATSPIPGAYNTMDDDPREPERTGRLGVEVTAGESQVAAPPTKSGFMGRLRDAMSPTRLFTRRPSQPDSIHSAHSNSSLPNTPSSNPSTPNPFPPPSPSTLAPPVVSTSIEADHLPNPSYFASNPASSYSRTGFPVPSSTPTPSTSLDSLARSPRRSAKASLSASNSGSSLRSSPSRKSFAPLPTAYSPPPLPSPPSFPPPLPLPSPRPISNLSLAASSSRLDKHDPYASLAVLYNTNTTPLPQHTPPLRLSSTRPSSESVPPPASVRLPPTFFNGSVNPPSSSRAKLPLPSLTLNTKKVPLPVLPQHATSSDALPTTLSAHQSIPTRQQIIQARSAKALAASGLVNPSGLSASFSFTPFPAAGGSGSGGGGGTGRRSGGGPDLETMRPSFRPTPQPKVNGSNQS